MPIVADGLHEKGIILWSAAGLEWSDAAILWNCEEAEWNPEAAAESSPGPVHQKPGIQPQTGTMKVAAITRAESKAG